MTTTYASVITMHASSLRRGSHRRISRYHVARLPLHLIHLAIATNGPSAIKNANHPHSDEADEPSERLPPEIAGIAAVSYGIAKVTRTMRIT